MSPVVRVAAPAARAARGTRFAPPVQTVTADVGWATSWHEALEAMEMDVTETEAMLGDLHRVGSATSSRPSWEPPAGLGPLPATLAERARAVLRRQQQAAVELTRAMAENRQQRKVAAVVDQRPASVPVYVDTAV